MVKAEEEDLCNSAVKGLLVLHKAEEPEEKRERKREQNYERKRIEKQNAEEEKERKQEDDDKIELIIYYKNYNIS